jgi:hypothetical protein
MQASWSGLNTHAAPLPAYGFALAPMNAELRREGGEGNGHVRLRVHPKDDPMAAVPDGAA